ncbi:septum site-determining protein MinC [Priestia taiwanensis]|nr:septum site-determining protein MinC [Priestia taiwanensis]MBM7363608.1 septum site-determining protein MinC [Priestia taiwanensis]
MEQKQQYITIKGTKDGLTLHLEDTCAYEIILQELDEKLSTNLFANSEGALIPVHVHVGNRYLTDQQEEELRTLIRAKKNLVVDSIDSEVISKEKALEWKRSNEVVTVTRMVRSGQVLEVQGDLLLIGDVNPGGTVVAKGNIFIMGALRGIAHAGCYGNKQAVIAASLMKPMQLRISDIMSRAPDDHYPEDGNEMECAYVEDDQIVVDRIQLLTHLRPHLTRLERRM